MLLAAGLHFFTVYGSMGRPDMAVMSFTRKLLAGEPINVLCFPLEPPAGRNSASQEQSQPALPVQQQKHAGPSEHQPQHVRQWGPDTVSEPLRAGESAQQHLSRSSGRGTRTGGSMVVTKQALAAALKAGHSRDSMAFSIPAPPHGYACFQGFHSCGRRGFWHSSSPSHHHCCCCHGAAWLASCCEPGKGPVPERVVAAAVVAAPVGGAGNGQLHCGGC